MASGWHRNDDDWVQHPKTVALQELLNEPLADAYVERLRCWAGRFFIRGRFETTHERHLEMQCGWRGTPGELVAAFVKTGWIDRRNGGPNGVHYEVHDWWEKQGPLVEKAEKDAARKRVERARRRSAKEETASADRRADGAGTDGRDETDETDGTDGRGDAPAPLVAVTSDADSFWVRANDRRKASGHVNEHPPRNVSGWFSTALLELNGDADRLWRAFEHFLSDDYWRGRGAPFDRFQAHWRKYASEHYGKTPQDAPPQRDKPEQRVEGAVKFRVGGGAP